VNPPPIRRISPFLCPTLRRLDVDVKKAVPRVVAGGDAEAIHDLRVAIRRLRTLLRLARPVFGRFHADAVRLAYTQVFRATGELRDEEVLDETLDSVKLDEPSFVAWRALRAARERRLRRAAVAKVRGGELTQAAQLLKALVTLPVVPRRDENLAKFARRCVERARRRVERRRDVPPDDVVGLHDLRIAYKELRYASELLAAALPLDLASLAEPAARFQKRLGEIHDVDVALATVSRARALTPAARAELLKRLAVLRAKKVAKYLAEMAPDPPATPEPPIASA
jgi:CHAD domain-containing protein